MSTENEAGSTPAAESAATAPDGAPAVSGSGAAYESGTAGSPGPGSAGAPGAAREAAGGADAAGAPDVPNVEPGSETREARTEALPVQPPVGPPSPYGAPPAQFTSPYERGDEAPRPASAFEPPRPAPAYDAPPTPAHDAPRPAAPTAAFAAGQPPSSGAPYGGQQPAGSQQPYGEAKDPYAARDSSGPSGPSSSDPFAPPAQPGPGSPYVVTPHGQPGHGGSGGSGGPVWGAPVPLPPEDGRRRRGAGSLVAAVLVAALVAGGVGGGIGYVAARHDNNHNNSTTVSEAANPKTLNRAPTSVAGIANTALPSVVTIKATGSQESGTGTGFVYDKQGHILTNNHVVAPAASGGKLTATFSNGKTYDAEVVGRAQGYDVAVIKLKNAGGQRLDPLPLGNSDQAQVGDATIAIGAPYGLSGTVTTGIVSAVHRPVASSDGQGTSVSYMSAIQTDASINPGNSGGPLLNANGAVIGIDSAIQPTGNSTSGSQPGSVGLGFAIPINQAKRVADQLIKTGQPIYPVMRVTLDTAYTGDGAKVGSASGAVTPGGPGDKAGLRSGDIITKFGNTLIDSGQTLIGEIWQHSPNDQVSITYTRNGGTHTTNLTLGSRAGDSTN